jgi:YjbE family integral membrane protein
VSLEISQSLGPILQIIWIDIVLSGDNAVVIGLACRALPKQQRLIGITIGTSAAVILRALLTIVVVEVLALPLVRAVGGILLFWIAIKLALDDHGTKDIKPSQSILGAIWVIVVADAVMSLDNVMAIAAAADGAIVLVLFGLALSVPLIIFGSTLLLGLFARFPLLVWLGAAVLGYVAGELIGSEKLLSMFPISHSAYWVHACGIAGIAIVVVTALLLRRLARTRGGD